MSEEEFALLLLKNPEINSFYNSVINKESALEILQLIKNIIDNVIIVCSRYVIAIHYCKNNRNITIKEEDGIFHLYYTKNAMRMPLHQHDPIKFLTKCQRLIK